MSVAVTGEGIISAIGKGRAQTLEALHAGLSGVGPMTYLGSVHKDFPVGEVPFSNEELKLGLGIPVEKKLSRTALMGMEAITQCIEDAGLCSFSSGHPGLRVLLVSGTTVGGMDLTENCFGDFSNPDTAEILRQHDCGHCTRLIASYFGRFFDDVTTISTACSSAANAIMLGARLIRSGRADVVVAGGSESLSRFHLNGFRSLMILDHERCRPFDASRSGLNLGEGAAYVVLESEEVAQKRGAKIHAYVSGCGNACDAFHQTAMSSEGEGAFLAMKEALSDAALEPSDINYVNAHGTGTLNNDQSESVALKRIFGETLPPVSSTKAFTGHATSAAGSIEAVICLLALQEGFIPENLGWSQPMEGGILPSLGVDGVRLENVMCNSFGFGGNDTSLVFSVSPPCMARPSCSEGKIAEGPKTKVVSKVEINSLEELKDIGEWVKPLEARRMGKLMKAAFLSSRRALKQAGIESPDAIVTGTMYGCLENSEKLLLQMFQEGETSMKPTLFMQSTHNSIGSDIAIRTHCHGYNITFSQCEESLDWAIEDARLLLESGKCRNVLVGLHDESTPFFEEITGCNSGQTSVHSVAMVLTCGE